MADFPGLVLFEEDGKLLARIEPHAPRPPLDDARLRALLHQAGYGRWFLLEEALATLIARCNEGAGEFAMPLGERRDGSFRLDVAADGLTAWVELMPAQGGRELAVEDIVEGLGEAGISQGIDSAALQQACAASQTARVVAARGQPAQDGQDARFELLIEVVRERVPHTNAQGLIDFRELGAIPVVEVGQALMRRIPSTPGIDGCDVRGQALPAKPGQELKFAEPLGGTTFDPSDPDLLRAAVKGQPVHLGNGVLVEQVVRLERVDIASGNIDFDGSVQVDGDVMSGMQVKASGDIVVKGAVDGGLLQAGGDVQVAGGIIANARVQAGGAVSARFVEYAQIEAATTITVEDMVLQSDLQALNQVVIGVKSPQRGRLIGGSTRAMLLVQVPQLGGGTASTVTRVQVGVNPRLNERHRQLSELAEKQCADEDKLKKLVQHLAKLGDKDKFERGRATWRQATQAWARTLQEKRELEEQLATTAGAQVVVTQGTSGAVELLFGQKAFPLRSGYDAGAFSLHDQQLAFTPVSASSAVAS